MQRHGDQRGLGEGGGTMSFRPGERELVVPGAEEDGAGRVEAYNIFRSFEPLPRRPRAATRPL